MIRNNKKRILFLPHELRNHGNEGDDLIATASRIRKKCGRSVVSRNPQND